MNALEGDGLLLQLKGVSKSFVGVQSLDSVTFSLHRGEVHALVGENGAGKSTMIKIICGVHSPDAGELIYKGRKVRWHSPLEARINGISVIHQELHVAPNLTVAENVLMGAELPKNRIGIIRWDELNIRARDLLQSIGSDLDPRRLVSSLSVAQQQIVEIARALSIRADVIIMDEPTATLTEKEIDKLFQLIGLLRKRGVGIIYVSHRMEEIFRIADRVTVLRDGKHISTKPIQEVDTASVIRDMVGRDLHTVSARSSDKPAEVFDGRVPLMEVKSLSDGSNFENCSLVVRSGEIVGIAGLVGSGRSELLMAIFGASRIAAGEVWIQGRKASIKSPQDAIRYGIGLVPESRKDQALFLELAVGENISVLQLPRISRLGLIRRHLQTALESEYITRLGVKTPSASTRVMNLSGGNQQKAIIARWLTISPKILLLDEPTRGVDVGAKAEIYEIIRKLAEQGTGILLVSSDLPEVLTLCERVYVMYSGRLVKELERREVTQETIMLHATGGRSA